MRRVGLASLGLACVVLAGCSAVQRVPIPSLSSILGPPKVTSTLPVLNEEAFEEKPLRSYRIPTPKPGTIPEQTVIGEMSSHRMRQGETLLDVARYYDLGINEMTDANPGVDIWSPRVGSTVVVPTQWVLPCCNYEGMIVNVPELRLFYYEKAPDEPGP